MNSTTEKRELKLEAKTLVSQEDFFRLKEFLKIEQKDAFHQEDIILMDKHDVLRTRRAGTVLRVRKNNKNKKQILELRIVQPNGGISEHCDDDLTIQESNDLLSGNLTAHRNVFRALKGMNVGSGFYKEGKISTIRVRVPFANPWHVKIFLDHVWFSASQCDCEIRIISPKPGRSEEVLKEICKKLNIPIVETPSKIERYRKAVKV